MRFPILLLTPFLIGTLCAQQWNWAVSAGDGSNVDQCYGIATDGQGNVYWAGSVRGTSQFGCGTITTGSNTAGVLAKYDAAGNCQWVRSVLVTFDDALAYGIAIDAEDRIYITGSYNGNAVFSNGVTLGSLGSDDIFLARYDVNGNCIWARRAGSSGSSDEARGIAVDPDGAVFICGIAGGTTMSFDGISITNPGNFRQLVIARYDSTGTVQWAKASTGNGQSKSARGISVANDRLFVTGQFSFTTGDFDGIPISNNSMGGKAYVLACDLDGNALWANSYGSGDHEGMGISADTLGNVFMVGRMWGSMYLPDDTLVSVSSNDDFVILKFDADGNYQWGKSTGSTQRDLSWSTATDGQGNAYVAVQFLATVDFFGTSLSSTGGEDIAILKMDGEGDVVWARKAGGSQRDVPLCIHRQAAAPHQLYFGGYYWGVVTYGSTTIDDVANGDAMMISATDTTFDVSLYADQVCPGSCDGEAVAFTHGQGPFTFNWNGGATTPAIEGLCANTYFVEATDANGQVLIDMVNVEEFADPGYAVQIEMDSLWITSGEGFQWYFNNVPIAGADSSSFLADATGAYHALVTDASGCSWSSDTVLVVLNVGFAENPAASMHVWPNPSSGILSVDFPGSQKSTAELINSAGQRVGSLMLRPGVNVVDLTGMKNGLYVLRSAEGLVVRLVVE